MPVYEAASRAPRPNHASWNIVLFVFCVTLVGCSRSSSSLNHQLSWVFHSRWTAGGSSDSSVILRSAYPFEVASGDGDHVYALAGPDPHVLIFDSTGQAVAKFGREGRGPGEMVDPYGISVTRAGEVDVVDLGSGRVVRWDANGEALDPIGIQGAVDQPKMAMIGGRLWHTTWVGSDKSGSEYHLIAGASLDDPVMARLARPRRRSGDFPSCHARDISVQPLFAPLIHWDAAGGRVAVNAGAAYRVAVMDSTGATVAIIQRSILPPKADRAAALKEAQGWLLNGCVVPPEEVLHVTGFSDVIPVVQAVALSPAGELWVKRIGRDGGPTRIDVFDATGTYTGTLPPGSPWPAAFLGAHGLIAVDADSLDVPRLTSYDIAR